MIATKAPEFAETPSLARVSQTYLCGSPLRADIPIPRPTLAPSASTTTAS